MKATQMHVYINYDSVHVYLQDQLYESAIQTVIQQTFFIFEHGRQGHSVSFTSRKHAYIMLTILNPTFT